MAVYSERKPEFMPQPITDTTLEKQNLLFDLYSVSGTDFTNEVVKPCLTDTTKLPMISTMLQSSDPATLDTLLANIYSEDDFGKIFISFVRENNIIMAAPGVSTATAHIQYELNEQHIYGSSRLGMHKADTVVCSYYTGYYYNGFYNSWQPMLYAPQCAPPTPPANYEKLSRLRGKRFYELTNHLGNVLSTITDRKLPKDITANNQVDYFEADVSSATDFYPGGSIMPGRSFSANSYRYGFQNQESDDEVYGTKNLYAFEYRMNDVRLNRFWSVDPLFRSYPGNSPYAFAQNRLIDGIELEGLEWKSTKDKEGSFTGFDWDPDNAYNSEGKLNEGYFETAILFSEKANEPASGSANSESGFHATATVYKADGTTQGYNSTTLPSDSKLFGTVEEGLYKATLGTHPMSGGYPALNVFTLSGSRNLPAKGGVNPSNGSKFVSGVNIHKTGKNDYLGTYTKSNGGTGGISEGCFCIERGSGDALYNAFLGNFSSGQNIGIGLLRSTKPALNTTNSETIQYTLPIPEIEPVRIDNTYVAPKY